MSNEDYELLNNELINLKKIIDEKDIKLKDYENKIELQNSQLKYKDLQITNVKQQMSLKDTEIQNIEAKLLNKKINTKSKENNIESIQNELNNLENNKKLVESNNESKNRELIEKKYKELFEIKCYQLKQKETELKTYKATIKNLDQLKSEHLKLFSELDTKEYCINCYKEKIQNNALEIEYLKNSNKLSKKLIKPMAYLLLLSKSKPKEIITNIKLYKTLKNSNCFDIGYYMNNYPDIPKSNWCKYFSPELHYVCKGFNEKRKFNKKQYNDKNKMKLIEEIKNR